MSQYKKFGEWVTVEYPCPEWDKQFGRSSRVRVNWSCLGAVPIDIAETIVSDLKKAIRFAKKQQLISSMETNTCENCGKEHDMETSTSTADDCYLCLECQEKWKTTVFDKCQHEWKSYAEEDYMVCDGCHGVVHHEDILTREPVE